MFFIIFALSIAQIMSSKVNNNIVPKVDVSSSHEFGNRPSVGEGNFFVYSHTRKDKNEIFYIGIGTSPLNANTHKFKYKRAYQKWVA